MLALCAAAVVTALAAAAAAQSAVRPHLVSPQRAEIARAADAIVDTELSPQRLGRVHATAYWGGVYRTPSGETVTINVSDAFPRDTALGQRWADFLASLVHGSELSSVNVFLVTNFEIRGICGSGALACYSRQGNALIAPGEDPAADISAEAVVTHEYGHHVAASRSNAPWSALDYGTKRWASHEQVCTKARGGQLFPGAEDFPNYQLNPGEGFAEAYRLLNERRAGIAETPWQIVSESLYPDNAALSLLEQDVTTPWRGTVATTRRAALTRATRSRTFTVATPLDGTLSVTVRPSGGARVALAVSSAGTRVLTGSGARAFSRATTVCGQRTLRIRVSAVSGTGGFRLTVAKP